MRLSEAIRLGSMISEQGFNSLIDESGPVTRACALGAACLAIGKVGALGDWQRSFPTLFDRVDRAPCLCQHPAMFVMNIVNHLNEDHHWTRGKIADWVEEVERQHEHRHAVVEDVVLLVA